VERLVQEGGARVDDKMAAKPIFNVAVPNKPTMRETLAQVVEQTGFPSDALKLSKEEAIAVSKKMKETAS
jgi:hypothetical protein